MSRRYGRRAGRMALALAVACPVAAGGASAARAADVPTKLVGAWHKKMTPAEWQRAGVYRAPGVYTIVVEKTGRVIVYLPGAYRTGCRTCPRDFVTTIETAGARLRLGSVPVCSFKGGYGWTVSGRTLTLHPVADKKCPVRETFFGGSWYR